MALIYHLSTYHQVLSGELLCVFFFSYFLWTRKRLGCHFERFWYKWGLLCLFNFLSLLLLLWIYLWFVGFEDILTFRSLVLLYGFFCSLILIFWSHRLLLLYLSWCWPFDSFTFLSSVDLFFFSLFVVYMDFPPSWFGPVDK